MLTNKYRLRRSWTLEGNQKESTMNQVRSRRVVLQCGIKRESSIASDEETCFGINDGEHTTWTTADRREVSTREDSAIGCHDRRRDSVNWGSTEY